MNNNILVYGTMFSGKTALLREIYADLSALLRIRGYYTFREYDNEIAVTVKYHSFYLNEHIFSFESKNSTNVEQQLEDFSRIVLPELRLYPTPDLFLLDELNRFECNSDRLYQQIITIFSSRIPVIATTSDIRYEKIKELAHRTDVNFIKINSHTTDELYKEILSRLR